MRTLKQYVPPDDFDHPRQVDLSRNTAVLIRQSDHNAHEDHAFSRQSQLKLLAYAQRLRNDATNEHVRMDDEGAGVSGQKRIDEREELNHLYNDIKRGDIGSLVVMHEDRLFRDAYQTSATTFIELLAKYAVLLFVRTGHRSYDCTKPNERSALLERFIDSRNFFDDHVLGRMNSNQEAKALQGLYDGRNLPMGLVTQGKKQEQVIIIYELWAAIVRKLFARFKELGSFSALYREIEAMPYLFPDPPAEDLNRYSFKIRMTKVPGGFKPTSIEAVKYMLTNPAYIGAWIYNDAIVREHNHPAIIDYDLFRWAYQMLTGRNLQGEYLHGKPPRRLYGTGADALLKHILRDSTGLLYVVRPEHPEYIRQELVRDVARDRRLRRDVTFAIRAHLVDTIFIDRIKVIARRNAHLAGDIHASLTDLQRQHARALVSIEDQLTHVRMEQKKLLAFLQAQILDLTEREKSAIQRVAGWSPQTRGRAVGGSRSIHVRQPTG